MSLLSSRVRRPSIPRRTVVFGRPTDVPATEAPTRPTAEELRREEISASSVPMPFAAPSVAKVVAYHRPPRHTLRSNETRFHAARDFEDNDLIRPVVLCAVAPIRPRGRRSQTFKATVSLV